MLLLFAAARFWRRRPSRTGKLPEQPKWMATIGRMRARWVFLLGAFWINVALVVPAATDILKAELSTTDSLVASAVFALMAASVQVGMIVYAVAKPKEAAVGLGRIREWIPRNQEAVMAIVCVVIALYLAGQGIYGLNG